MKRVITYGTFDLLHYGHINLLERAKALGDYLIVALSTDEFNATLRKRMQGNCRKLIIGTLFSINDPFTRTINFFKENAPDRIEVIRLPRT